MPFSPAFSQLEEANSLWWNGEYSKAEKAYLEQAYGGQRERVARLELAAHYRSLSEYGPAIEQYMALISKAEPSDRTVIDEITIPMGECLYYAGRLNEAESAFRSVLETSPGSLRALFGLGRTLYEKGSLAGADAYLSLAALLFPQFSGSHIYLARIAEKMGEPQKAIDSYMKALKIDGLQVELRYSLGELFQGLDLFEESFKEYHRLRSMDADNAYVIARLEEVSPRLARREQEIIPVKTLEKFAPLKHVPRPEKIPLLRIGLNTDQRGRTIFLDSIAFLANESFRIRSSGNEAQTGVPGVIYRIILREGRMYLTVDSQSEAGSAGGDPEPLEEGSGSQGEVIPVSVLGGTPVVLSDKVLLEPLVQSKTSFIVKRVEYARGFAWAGIADRQYRGKLEVSLHNGGLKIVNIVNLEEYLYSVVPSEMMVSFPLEALKAQAVIARSYALATARYNRPHESDGYDLCDGQHCQVYSGSANEYAKSTSAIDKTRGEVLMYARAVARPLFHSTCGGHTQSVSDLKGWGDAPYLTGVVDGPGSIRFPSSPLELERWIKTKPEVYCSGDGNGTSPEFRWFRIVPAVFVEEKINRTSDVGDLLKVTIVRRNSSGYVNSLLVTGTKGNATIERENEIRRFLGIGPLRSGLFWLETKFGVDGRPDEFVIFGGGWGHGIGMCQTGAGGMARRGFFYREILSHYYGRVELKTLGY